MPYGGYGIQPWGFQWGDPNSALIGSSASTPDVQVSSVALTAAAQNVRTAVANQIKVRSVSITLPTKVGPVSMLPLHKPAVACDPYVEVSTITCA